MKKTIIRYITTRLTEASTIRGLILGLGATVGLVLSPEQTDSLVWIILGLIAFVGTFAPDHIPTPKEIEENKDTVRSPPGVRSNTQRDKCTSCSKQCFRHPITTNHVQKTSSRDD
jgi:hypothetical protein